MMKIFGYTAYTLTNDLVKLWQNKKGCAKHLPFFNCAAVKRQILGASLTAFFLSELNYVFCSQGLFLYCFYTWLSKLPDKICVSKKSVISILEPLANVNFVLNLHFISIHKKITIIFLIYLIFLKKFYQILPE